MPLSDCLSGFLYPPVIEVRREGQWSLKYIIGWLNSSWEQNSSAPVFSPIIPQRIHRLLYHSHSTSWMFKRWLMTLHLTPGGLITCPGNLSLSPSDRRGCFCVQRTIKLRGEQFSACRPFGRSGGTSRLTDPHPLPWGREKPFLPLLRLVPYLLLFYFGIAWADCYCCLIASSTRQQPLSVAPSLLQHSTTQLLNSSVPETAASILLQLLLQHYTHY